MKSAVSPPRCEAIEDDSRLSDVSLHPFLVSTARGFLPLREPLVTLPAEFDALEKLLQRMPIKTASGEAGLLAHGKLGEAAEKELPDLTAQIDVYKNNLHVITALYRDYSFLAEGYLLEPCHRQFMENEDYGLGRRLLPRQIARPFVRCAEIAGFKPYLEFSSYVLLNYRLENPAAGLEFSNLRLIRAFEHGLDPTSSESGFILVHLTMVKHSGPLVQGVLKAFAAASQAKLAPGMNESRESLNEGLSTLVGALANLNALMKIIYQKSKPTEYNNFRTFMFGITSNSMFPDGVIYEGCNDDKPMFFRGETGANDAMVPLMDNFLQISMPDTPLTEILEEFSEYRSDKHKDFLIYVKEQGMVLRMKEFSLGQDEAGEPSNSLRESRGLWLQILDQVREFRWRHWGLVKEYILKRSDHPTATGGSPIVTWLPNQLEAVLDEMIYVHAIALKNDARGLGKTCETIMEVVRRQKEMLKREVERYCAERG